MLIPASASHWSATPTISAHARLDAGCGFLPDRNVTLRITRAGEDIGDYPTSMTDGDGYLHGELPNSATRSVHRRNRPPTRSWGCVGPTAEQHRYPRRG
jgi:hypothetical protein